MIAESKMGRSIHVAKTSQTKATTNELPQICKIRFPPLIKLKILSTKDLEIRETKIRRQDLHRLPRGMEVTLGRILNQMGPFRRASVRRG
jgi:hypothetical protein